MKVFILLTLLFSTISCKHTKDDSHSFLVVNNKANYWKKLEGLPEFNAKLHSDGCSGGMSEMYSKMTFLHKNNGKQLQWRNCCEIHDRAYYYGGSKVQKKQADVTLNQCVSKVIGQKFLGKAMELAVKLGGSPYLPTPYRWGYGEDFRE